MHRVAVRVAGEREDVSKRAFAAALVTDDGDHVRVERQFAVEPSIRSFGVGVFSNVKPVYEPRGIAAHLFELGRDAADIDAVLRLVDDLAQSGEGRVGLDPAIFVGRPGVLVLQLAELVVDVVGVAALDAWLPVSEPLAVGSFAIFGVLP